MEVGRPLRSLPLPLPRWAIVGAIGAQGPTPRRVFPPYWYPPRLPATTPPEPLLPRHHLPEIHRTLAEFLESLEPCSPSPSHLEGPNHDCAGGGPMSASPPSISNASSPDITCIASEPFEPKPLIADILRTGFCVPDSVVLVESVDVAHTSRSKRWRTIRLLLGDGELCIQALLSPDMHRLVDCGEIAFGSYVRLQQFSLEWRDVVKATISPPRGPGDAGGSAESQKGKMVYLVVESLVMVGWNNTLINPAMAEQAEIGIGQVELRSVAPETRVDLQTPSNLAGPDTADCHEAVVAAPTVDEDFGAADLDDDFEVMDISTDRSASNRENVASAIVDHASTSSGTGPWSAINPSQPEKLTKLRSISHLPFKQNWSVNVLCVISAISEVEPAGIPPYTQRQARLTDPSTNKQVHFTVFLDPHFFNPQIGSVVLLLGVKNHRFDGGSLKKYASDQPKLGERWWYQNPEQFPWCDVAGLRRWWTENQMRA
ncbi:hypothetical protein F4808DRAFT_472231 [Astrocystis sublimbata]|nr:hypothetical protein F4808DRAFT_472231 [Astrocystis sublimbata]